MTLDKAVRFEAINQLRDIRLHTREPLRQLRQRQRLARVGKRFQGDQLRERQPDRAEFRFDLTFRGMGRTQDRREIHRKTLARNSIHV